MQKPSRNGGQPGSLSLTLGHEAPAGVWAQKSHGPGQSWAQCSQPTWSPGEGLAPPALVFPVGASSTASPPHPPSAGTLEPVPKGFAGVHPALGSWRTDAPESIAFYPDAASRDSAAIVKYELPDLILLSHVHQMLQSMGPHACVFLEDSGSPLDVVWVII